MKNFTKLNRKLKHMVMGFTMLATVTILGCVACVGATPRIALMWTGVKSKSINPNTIIFPKAVSSNISDGTTYMGVTSGTNFQPAFHVVWLSPPGNDHLKEVKVSVSGIGPEGLLQQVVADQIWSTPQVQYWEQDFRISTTAFSDSKKIIITTSISTFGNSNVTNQKFSWLVWNSFFAGGNKDFDTYSWSTTQENVVQDLADTMASINHRVAKSVSFDAAAINAEITDSTVFYMSSHGTLGDMGDCLVKDDTKDMTHDIGPDAIATDIVNKGAITPIYNFLFIDTCLTFDSPNYPEAFLTGTYGAHGLPIPGTGSDRAALGWKESVETTSDDDDFSRQLYSMMAHGFTLHKSIVDCCHAYPITGRALGSDTYTEIKPALFGDPLMTLYGVYNGNQPVNLWWKLIYNGPDRN